MGYLNPVFVLLSIFDIFAGVLVYFSNPGLGWIPMSIVLYTGIFHAIKGAWSMMSAIVFGWFYDWMGFLDFLAGIFLVFATFSISFGVAHILGILVVIKGIYSLLLSL